jgi:hypothetical protein
MSEPRRQPRFVLMLTLHDRTVPDALDRYDELHDLPVACVGFKDVGLDSDALHELTRRVHADGREVFLEVVSLSADDELRSARLAVELGADFLIGGVRHAEVVHILAGTPLRYYPYVGSIVGHPCQLAGDPAAIVRAAHEVLKAGADGVNILAYRYRDGDPIALLDQVVEATGGSVIVAGDIASRRQIEEVSRAGAWAFTIGGALLERRFAARATFAEEVAAVLEAQATQHAEPR